MPAIFHRSALGALFASLLFAPAWAATERAYIGTYTAEPGQKQPRNHGEASICWTWTLPLECCRTRGLWRRPLRRARSVCRQTAGLFMPVMRSAISMAQRAVRSRPSRWIRPVSSLPSSMR
jgi:hypothetical protein